MTKEGKSGHDREMPNAHLYHMLMPLIFVLVFILDSQVFLISVFLSDYIPLLIRVIMFGIFFVLAITFIMLSHRALFDDNNPSNTIITNGILGHVRNPMYLGILFIYIAFIALSLSLICIALFFIVFLVYNKMVRFEENILKEMFGNDFLEYMKQVPRWIPKI